MNLSKIENYFTPDRILDIGANVGQFHILCQNYFPNSYIFSIEASKECEQYLKQITNQYSICLLSKDDSEYNFYSIKNNPINTGNSIYKELTHHYSEDQLTFLLALEFLSQSIRIQSPPISFVSLRNEQ